MHRRTFLYNATLGTLSLGLGGVQPAQVRSPLEELKIELHTPDMPRSPLGMPGLFAGRVVEVTHPEPIVNRRVSATAVRKMLDAGITALTGDDTATAAWARFFVPADIVAIKVNPSGTPVTVTSIALVREVIGALNGVGVPHRNIVIYDRNSNQLELHGYHALVDGVAPCEP